MDSKRYGDIKVEYLKDHQAEEMAKKVQEAKGSAANSVRDQLDDFIKAYTINVNNVLVYGGKALQPILPANIASKIPSVDWDLFAEVESSDLKDYEDMEKQTEKAARNFVASLAHQIQNESLPFVNPRFQIFQTPGVRGGIMAQIVFVYERNGKDQQLHLADISCCEKGKYNTMQVDGTHYMNPFYTINCLAITLTNENDIDDSKIVKRKHRLKTVEEAIKSSEVNPAVIQYYNATDNHNILLYDEINYEAEKAIIQLADLLNVNVIEPKKEFDDSDYFSDSDSESFDKPREPNYEELRSYLKDVDDQPEGMWEYLRDHYTNSTFSEFLMEKFFVNWRDLDLKNVPFDPETAGGKVWINYFINDFDRNFSATGESKQENERTDYDSEDEKSTLIRDSASFLLLSPNKNPSAADESKLTENPEMTKKR